ncbi:MAG: GspH/FimT family pseudopilin [Pseudomonadota bacterium]|nr:GspH/FimT family pseudopilin [Pseudomonadota bacterium]
MRGFTMIELMITLSLLTIVLLLVLSTGRQWLVNSRIRTAAESIQNGLQAARAEAVRCNIPVQFVLDGLDSSWKVEYAYPNVQTSCTPTRAPGVAAEPVQKRGKGEGSTPMALTVQPTNARQVTFDGTGRRVANADASATLARVCVDDSNAGDSRDLEINITAGGSVRMCDPKVTDTADSRICPDRANSSCTSL